MADRNVSDLCPELQGLLPVFIANCADDGITVRAIVTWRSATDQNDAKLAGLSNAAAGQSPHNHINAQGLPCSLAFDFGVFDQGAYVQNGQDARYSKAGAIAKGMGLVWGGDFTHPDYDHIELANWRQYRSSAETATA